MRIEIFELPSAILVLLMGLEKKNSTELVAGRRPEREKAELLLDRREPVAQRGVADLHLRDVAVATAERARTADS